MENQTAPAANEPTGPMLSIQSVYLKDCSYEAPKGPRVEGNWSPQISLDINTTATVVAPEVHEVVITVTVGAKQGEATAFLVEVKQAGLFIMRGLTADDMPLVRKIVRDAGQQQYRFTALLQGIVASAPFQMRLKAADSPQLVAGRQ